jgi:hypothetical protein
VRKVERLRRAAEAVLQAPVVDPLLGTTTVAASDIRVDDLQARMDREQATGHTWHERVHQALRFLLVVVLLADGAVLLQFLSGVFNVDWNDPYGVPLLLATVFAAGDTLITFGALTLAGVRLRQRRDTDGAVAWRDLDGTTYLMLGAAVAAAIGVAGLMYERISYGVTDSLGELRGLPVVFGLAFALFSVVANLTVVHVHAVDGSPQAHRAADLSRAVGHRMGRHRRFRRCAARAAHRIATRVKAAREVRDLCVTEATRKAGRVWLDADERGHAPAPDLRAVPRAGRSPRYLEAVVPPNASRHRHASEPLARSRYMRRPPRTSSWLTRVRSSKTDRARRPSCTAPGTRCARRAARPPARRHRHGDHAGADRSLGRLDGRVG